MSTDDANQFGEGASAHWSPLRALVSHWKLASLLSVAGMVAGLVVASLGQTTYTGEARVAVGAGDLSSGAIAGFPLAASELASNYARYVNDSTLIDDDFEATVTASQIPDSNVIRIEAMSSSPSEASLAAQSAAEGLTTEVNDPTRSTDDLFREYRRAATTWSEVTADLDGAERALAALRANGGAQSQIVAAVDRVTGLRSDQASAELRMDALGTQYQGRVSASEAATLTIIGEASITYDDARSRIQRYALLGLVLGIGLAICIATVLDRRQRPSTTVG